MKEIINTAFVCIHDDIFLKLMIGYNAVAKSPETLFFKVQRQFPTFDSSEWSKTWVGNKIEKDSN